MKKPDDAGDERSTLRDKIIGLGEQSFRKSYFPQLQTQLQRSEQFRRLFDHTQDGIYITDGTTGLIIDANKMGAQFFHTDIATLLQTRFADHFASPHREFLLELLVTETPAAEGVRTLTVETVRADGGSLFLEFTVNIAVLQDKRFLLVIGRDVTERYHTEQKIRASLTEKAALLKEVHHRVKNNLQVISSLLHMQAAGTTDPVVQAVFHESQTRVKSMALIHERLYQSSDLSSINFKDYLPSVTRNLLLTYGRTDIELSIEAQDVSLSIENAVPAGLIVNELVSNALKHAFPDGRRGAITVALHAGEHGTVRLAISDTGIGFPGEKDPRTMRSMGMTLVRSLVEQLDGTISLDRTIGTRFTMEFPHAQGKPVGPASL